MTNSYLRSSMFGRLPVGGPEAEKIQDIHVILTIPFLVPEEFHGKKKDCQESR